MKDILLATDFSELARQAYPVAASLAREFDARIHLAHEVPPIPTFYFDHADAPKLLEQYYHDFLEELKKEQEHPALQGVTVDLTLLSQRGERDDLVSFANDHSIDLIVLSPHGASGLTHVLLGSFAEKIIRYSKVPVYTCRQPSGDFTPRKILVPYDLSENSKTALPLAMLLAERYDAQLTFLFVLSKRRHPLVGNYFLEVLRDAEEKALSAARPEIEALGRKAGLEPKIETTEGPAAGAIVEFAREHEVDLILMATHGRTGPKRVLLGSVAESVSRLAPCSVLTIRPSTAAADGDSNAKESSSAEVTHFFG